jgi:folate-dependent phosphoribosylglycinamide formyltransferase PurN
VQRIHVQLQAVVSDVPSCGGVSYAKEHGIPTLTYPASKKGLFPGLTPQELVQQLKQELGADYVLLAGYLKVCMVAGGDEGSSSWQSWNHQQQQAGRSATAESH